MEEQVILVNVNDEVLDIGEKIQTHVDGALHRAFSIFIFNSSGELLLQRRARTKYHSGSLWSNTCCGHPRPGEKIEEAANRRLQEEMGFNCKLENLFSFIYKTELDNNFREHEYDYVLKGLFNGEPLINLSEVEEWKWVDLDLLIKDVKDNPCIYTYWLNLILTNFLYLQKLKSWKNPILHDLT